MTLFLKLGGSLITDKTKPETVRQDVLRRSAAEIQTAVAQQPGIRLLIGHGSGSFGHVAAAKYGTRHGVATPDQWHGFAEVGTTAARLNKIVIDSLQQANLPAFTLQPSASVLCHNGRLVQIMSQPVQMALNAGLVPVIHGDVAFDSGQGGTIVSTEEVMMALAADIPPTWLLLAGETDGVYDAAGNRIPAISAQNFESIRGALGGSRGTDVTGGMVAKVESMLALVRQIPGLKVRIFSGLVSGNINTLISAPSTPLGTVIL